MAAKQAPCPLKSNGKHKWEHVRDITVTHAKIGPRGTSVRMSARGEYKCECGANRVGASVGGL
jgi:hypothetical protein